MEKKVFKRSGRPNRGGGRHNRGGRGRGRGFTPPEPTKPKLGGSSGIGGRKSGANLYDDDDIYDAYEDDRESDDFFRGRPNYEMPRKEPESRKDFSKGARGFRGRGGRVKVTMQHLHMTSENQELVKGMLKDLHGNEVDVTSEDEYEELDYRAENQYWIVDNKLKMEDSMAHGTVWHSAGPQSDDAVSVSTLAVNKLKRYGFHKTRSTEALQVCDGDLGLALEYLLAECFCLNNSEDTDTSADVEEITELRNDEMMALQAIYDEKFNERIPNRVWILKISLPYLDKMSQPKTDRKQTAKKEDKRNLCRFYQKGFCKFGKRCRLEHSLPVDKHVAGSDSAIEGCAMDTEYEIEIRFPPCNRYPKEAPFIAFTSTSSLLEKHVCLNITKHMIDEAKKMAESQEPCIFTVVNLLDDETFLDNVLNEAPHEFSRSVHNRAWFPQQTDLENSVQGQSDRSTFNIVSDKDNYHKESPDNTDAKLAKATESMIKMSERDRRQEEKGSDEKPVEVKRSTSKEEVRKQNPAEILKTNKRLIEDFKRKKTSGKYKTMQESRQKLPAWFRQDEILQMISEHQVVVISGMTGCGKTTQVPQFILDLYLNAGDLHLCNILCTQPRRISAIAVAERVAEERADALGRIVGYQIRLEKMQSSMTRLLFCTTGIVLRRLEGDTTLDGVSHLIIDEVHERSEESDFLLMYLKDMLPKRPDLKIILMSATLNAQLFSQYFGGCAVVDIPGRTFPVEQYFLEDAMEFTEFVMEESSPYARPLKHMNAVQRGVALEEEQYDGSDSGPTHKASDRVQDQNLSVKQLYLRYADYHKSTLKNMALMDHTKINFDLVLELMCWLVTEDHQDLEFPVNGAVLVFMPGYAEIQTLYDMLLSCPVFGGRNKHRYKIIPLHSTLSSEDQHAVFSKPPEEVTKIVIATNIAETSITIDDICFVIDTGKMKEKRYDSTKGMESLDTVWVSRANALQRKGRAGRVRSGICFHLFTSHRFEHHLQEQPVPEIQRAPLEQICLRIRMLDIFKRVPVEVVLHKLPEPPEYEAITSAIKRLEVLGALDSHGELTPLGYHLGTLPVDVRIGKLMLLGAIFRCLDPALTIAACLSFKSPFVTPFGKKHEATEKKLEFAAGNSDHLTMLNAYNAWKEARKNSGHEAYRFCQDNFLSKRSLEMLSSMKQQFVELLSDIGFVKEGISSKDVERAARNGEDGVSTITGPEANLNSKNLKLISALLVGALYPNIVQVLTPEQQYTQVGGGTVAVAPKAEDIRFKTKPDGYVKIHPSSVNFQVRFYESPYLVYHEKVKTTRIYIRDSTMVSVYPLLLFGGGEIGVDLSRGNFILSVDDGWIKFMAQSHQIAELVRELRLELDHLLEDKIKNPHMDLCTCPRGSKIIDTIVKLITTQ
ncbi:putative ATP-dependent RNA helicase DHX57 [Mercenaria mercenaria]|uniref:putative ATP-dependent RNA helicase DHX57 n=1 Tax=Mercenaria mercenaria TaxID=6596 RepID=UPI00234E88D6|nr:putative ATP-dependent RNA helicase DHX57 [Mercenaria mercenaria]